MVDIIMGANVEVLNKWLQDNPLHEFRARKTGDPKDLPWSLQVNKIDPGTLAVTNVYQVHSHTMGDGLKQLSRWIYEKNVTGTKTDRLTLEGKGNLEEKEK